MIFPVPVLALMPIPFLPEANAFMTAFTLDPQGGFQADLLKFSGQVLVVPADFMKGFVDGGELLEEDRGELGV